MGFLNNNDAAKTGAANGDELTKKQAHGPNFGQRLEQYYAQKHPLVGGLMEQVFGPVPQQQSEPIAKVDSGYGGPTPQPAIADVTGMNAMPKQGGGAALLKLLMGA